MTVGRAHLPLSALVLVLAACQQAPVDQSAAAAEAVRAADIAWAEAFSARDTSGAVATVEPTGSVLAPNTPIATGHDAVRALFAGFYALPGMSIHWEPTKVEAARSGDLAYSTGTYELTTTGPKGAPTTDHGKYATIWRKQSDGTWKVVVDVFNSDLTAPSP